MKNRKIAALILSVMMVICTMPSFVFATDTDAAEPQSTFETSGQAADTEESAEEKEAAEDKETAADDETAVSSEPQDENAKAEESGEALKEESGEAKASEEKVKEEAEEAGKEKTEEKSEVKTEKKAPEEKAKEDSEEAEKKAEDKKPAFKGSKTVDGVKVTVSAEEGAFPEGAKLVVSDVNASEEKKVDSAVDKVRDGDANVALSYVFDIHVEDKDGKEIQPADGRDVKVSFETEEVADSNLATDVYHVTDRDGSLKAEALDVKTDGDTASAGTDGFSYYTVEFTYGDLQYSMKGDSEIALSTILEDIGLTGTVTKAVSSNPELFSVENNGGAWTVTANQAFCSEETLSLTIDGIDYVVKVTDSQHSHTGTVHGISGWQPWNNKTSLPTSGKYYLNTDVTIAGGSGIQTTGDLHLCLNGHSIRAELASYITLFNIGGAHNVCIYDSEDNSGVIYSSGGIVSFSSSNVNNTFTLNGGILDGSIGTSARARVVFLQDKGTFNMNGGVIRNFTVSQTVVFVGTNSTFNMAGGLITGNKSTTTSDRFGSVVGFNGSDSTLVANLTGGTITGNTSNKDGVGAVHVYNGETVNISGNVIITGNTTNGTECNVHVKNYYEDRFINITGNLGSEAKIGITSQKAPTEATSIRFTNGLNNQGTIANFVSDNSDYAIGKKSNEAHLIIHIHEYNYTADGDTIIAKCKTDGCPLPDSTATLKIVKPARTVYGGTESAEATFEGEIPTVTPTAVYKKGEETLSAAPTNAGTYRAQVTLTGSDSKAATAYVDYTIQKADISPVVNIDDWDYGETAKDPSVTEASNPGSGTVTYEYYTDEACTQKTTSAQGATEEGGVPSYGGDYWVKATVEETDNYNSGTGTKGFKINATAVKVTGLKFVSKEYDGNTTATLDTSKAELEGVPSTEDVHIASATGVFDNKNVGPGKTISNITIVLSGSKAGGYKATADPTTLTGAITAKPVTVSGITASDKIYNGNTSAELDFSNATFEGMIKDDDLSVKGKDSQEGIFDTKDVGSDKTVTLPTLKLDGGDAGNYTIKKDSQATTTANITQKTITVSSGITSPGKEYDGNKTAPLDTSAAVLTGKVGEDDISVSAEGSFDNANAGKNKPISISAYELTGDEKDNYVLAKSGHQEATEGDITQKEIGLDWSDTELTYNGNVQKPKAAATGLVGKDECTVSVGGGKTDSNVKSGQASYTATAESLSNDNYKLPTDKTTSFTIAQKEVTVSGITASDKPYDGNTSAELDFSNASFEEMVEGDDLSVTGKDSQKGTFDTKDVGTDKTVTLPTLKLDGEDAENYAIKDGSQTEATASITAKAVNVTAEDKSKTYGETDPELTYTADPLIGEDKYTGVLKREEGEDVGTYEIQQGSLTAGDNYTINYTKGTFTIDKAMTNKVTASIEGWTYGEDSKDPSATADFGQDTATFTYSDSPDGTYTSEVPKTAGTWYVKATVPETKNYVEGVSDPVEFVIAKKEIGLEWTDTEFTYDGAAHKPKAAATGLEEGDECEVTVDGEQTDANAKTSTKFYEAEATELSNPNYKLPENVTTKFTIAPKELTQAMITLDKDTIKHDGTKKGPAVTMTDSDIMDGGSPKKMAADEDYTLGGEVTSSDLGTHVITVEGKGNYSGSIETSWMMYSKKSNDQKEEGTEGRGDFEVFGDIESNTSDITVDNFNIELAKGFLTEEDMARYMEGEDVLIYMIIKEQPKSETGAGDRYILGQLFREEGATDITWYDITVWKKIGNSPAVKVHDTGEEIRMSVEVPDAHKNAPEGYTREFYMGRSHDGASKLLAQTSEVKVGFGSSKFSTYALAYKDTEKPKDDPGKGGNGKGGSSKGGTNTGDPNDIAGLIALMLASGGALGAIGYRRRRTGSGR